MRTAQEFWFLATDTLTMWARAFPRLGFWFCVGYLVQAGGLWAALTIGPERRVLSTLVFILGEIGWVAALILMLHSARTELWSPRRLAQGRRLGVPPSVFDPESALRTLLLALGPFLAVYSLWGMTDDRIRALFQMNAQSFGMDAEAWSVSFAAWPTYAGIALVALVLRLLLSRFLTPTHTWLQVPILLAEGTWVFASFFVLRHFGNQAWEWLTSRAFWVGAENTWYRLADSLPDWPLIWPLGEWRLPQAVQEGWGWFWSAFLPGVGVGLALPLVWLALVAVVHGWRQFRAVEILAGTPVARVSARTLPLWADWASADLRQKYLPVAASLRLILAAGPRFLGAYLVLATVVQVGQEWLGWALAMMVGVRPLGQALAFGFLWDFLAAFVGTTVLLALYLAAFDRGITETVGRQHASESGEAALPGGR
ncbi:MAG: hypothetical protein Q4F67_13705 [Propionibacteriaceae bacterium]|nr:hypothetical protein [Propionibacteriaceae bacterium]